MSKCQSLSTTTVLFRTTFTQTIKLNLLLQSLVSVRIVTLHFCPSLREQPHFATPPSVSLEMISEEPLQKFHADDVSLPRFGLFFWLVEENQFLCSSTNWKHLPDLGCDKSWVWNICPHSWPRTSFRGEKLWCVAKFRQSWEKKFFCLTNFYGSCA